MKKPHPPSHIGRKRMTLGWTLLTLAILFTALWAQSRWWYNGFDTTHAACSVRQGIIIINIATGPTPTAGVRPGETPFRGVGFVSFSMQGGLQCWRWRLPDFFAAEFFPNAPPTNTYSLAGLFRTYSSPSYPWTAVSAAGPTVSLGGAPIRTIEIVLWPAPFLLFTAGFWLIRSGHRASARARGRCCTRCGYSLTGLAVDAACPECGKTKA